MGEKGWKFFGKCRKLINYFNNSNKRAERLKRLQPAGEEVKLLTFSATRWTGCFVSLARLHRLSGAIQEFFRKLSQKERPKGIMFTDKEWRLIPELLLMLKPFYDATVRMQFKHKPVGSYKYLIINDVVSSLRRLSEKDARVSFKFDKTAITKGKIVSRMGKTALKRLTDEFLEVFVRSVAPLVPEEKTESDLMFFDPRMKKWAMTFDEFAAEQIEKNVKVTIKRILTSENNKSNGEDSTGETETIEPKQSQGLFSIEDDEDEFDSTDIS